MSSILKALEKVEDAKNPRRTSGAGGLGRGRERRSAWVIPAWALGGAAVAALVTFFFMGGLSKSGAPATGQAVPATVVVPPLNVVPESAPPAATRTPSVPALKAAPLGASKGVPAAAPKARQASAVQKERVAAAKPVQKSAPGEESAPSRARAAVAKASPVGPAAIQAAPAVAAPVPAAVAQAAPEKALSPVRVTGIAWQKDSESSVAMVNGRPVRQGAVVDGFKVEQIYENSVRFSSSNGNLTVPLGAGED